MTKAECKRDHASYASIIERSKRNAKLRNWFNNMSEDDKAEWYRRQQIAHVGGRNRVFDQVYNVVLMITLY